MVVEIIGPQSKNSKEVPEYMTLQFQQRCENMTETE